jgi:hypothetical protein
MVTQSATPIKPIPIIGTPRSLYLDMPFNWRFGMVEQPSWMLVAPGRENPPLTSADKPVLMNNPVLVFVRVSATCPGPKFKINQMIHRTVSRLTTGVREVVRPSPNDRV